MREKRLENIKKHPTYSKTKYHFKVFVSLMCLNLCVCVCIFIVAVIVKKFEKHCYEIG